MIAKSNGKLIEVPADDGILYLILDDMLGLNIFGETRLEEIAKHLDNYDELTGETNHNVQEDLRTWSEVLITLKSLAQAADES